VTQDELLRPLKGPLRDLTRWLGDRRIPYVIVGGVAAGLQGKGRATGDVDAVVLADESRLEAFIQDSEAYGFVPRIPEAAQFARENRIILLRHVEDNIGVDLALGFLEFEKDMIARARHVHAFGLDLPIARPEELIVMKVLPMRPRDIADMELLLDANTDVDLQRVRDNLRLLSEMMEAPELPEKLERFLRARQAARSPKKPRRKSD
jgi:hypothetical protein